MASRTHKENRKATIVEAALTLFGEKGFEATTISAISEVAEISDATFYEYFASKEELLFTIPALYTGREVERMHEVARYIHSPREKLRVLIQAYLEFYENNKLYSSVALMTLKGNRNFIKSPAYETVREASRPIIEACREGMEAGVFREDLDPYLVRNLVLGTIEHLVIQWLILGRPERVSPCRDAIFEMIIRAIEKPPDADPIHLHLTLDGLEKIRREG